MFHVKHRLGLFGAKNGVSLFRNGSIWWGSVRWRAGAPFPPASAPRLRVGGSVPLAPHAHRVPRAPHALRVPSAPHVQLVARATITHCPSRGTRRRRTRMCIPPWVPSDSPRLSRSPGCRPTPPVRLRVDIPMTYLRSLWIGPGGRGGALEGSRCPGGFEWASRRSSLPGCDGPRAGPTCSPGREIGGRGEPLHWYWPPGSYSRVDSAPFESS